MGCIVNTAPDDFPDLTFITSCSTLTDMLASLGSGAAAAVTASPAVIPNGAYVPASNDNGMVVTVSNKDFLETGILL